LIREADIYFCAGYNSDFFLRRQFVDAYNWQQEEDLVWYRQTLSKKIEQLGAHFHKIRKFIPIAPNLATSLPVNGFKRKVRNLEHKITRWLGSSDRFSDDYKGFLLRYQQLLELRKNDLVYDIVLNDTLWGWPQHRINLHQSLQELQGKGFRIHSILKWADPVENDGSLLKQFDKNQFPIITLPINGNYETMISQSRLAVFACGFHWGWRNIMMLALMTGVPVLTDRLLTEAYFDLNEFSIFQTEDHQWKCLEGRLADMSEEKWKQQKARNHEVYDRYMAPEQVGRYFLNTCTKLF
jgi:hypothetical protein